MRLKVRVTYTFIVERCLQTYSKRLRVLWKILMPLLPEHATTHFVRVGTLFGLPKGNGPANRELRRITIWPQSHSNPQDAVRFICMKTSQRFLPDAQV